MIKQLPISKISNIHLEKVVSLREINRVMHAVTVYVLCFITLTNVSVFSFELLA